MLKVERFNIKSLYIILLVAVCNNLHAQDLHFSQFFNSPLSTNPANTGFIPDADYRMGANYRNQWSSVMGQPYKTTSVFGDAQVLRDKLENGWLGIGGLILHDEAGSGSLKSTKLYASVAYHQMLGLSSLLTAGFNAGWATKSIDVSKLKFPDQFDGKFFDNTLPTTVVLNNTNVNYLDVQAGINYAYFPKENIYFNAGYSIHHINRPKETFFNDQTNAGRIPMRHIGFMNALLRVSPNVIVNPNVYYTNQAGASSLVLGVNANYNLSEAGEKQVIGGMYYRFKDAIIPMLGIELNNLRITYSYDATVSSLTKFNSLRGGSELSIIKKGFYTQRGDRSTMCPSFQTVF